MEAADNLLLQQNSFLLGLSDGVKPEPPQLQESIFASQLAALSNNPYSSAALGRYLHLDVTHDHNMPLLQPPFMPGDPLHPTSSAGPTRSGSGGLSTSNESGNGLAPTAKTASGKPVKTPQKRFRERQKEKMSTLEQEVAAKTAEFERLAKENEKLKARAVVLEKVVACRDEQLALMSQFNGHCERQGHPSSCFGLATGPVVNEDAIKTSPNAEMIKSLTREQVITHWKKFLAEVTGILLNCTDCHGDHGDPEKLERITSMVREVGGMLKHIMILNPAIMRSLLTVNMENGQTAVAPAAHWANVVAALNLTESQRTDILSVFDLYRGLIIKVYEERRLITRALAPSLQLMATGGNPTGVSISRATLPEEMELLDKLNSNLVKENGAQLMLMCFLLGKVMSAAQFSRVSVYSYPFFPDALALASTIAEQASYFAGMPQRGGSGSGL